MRKCGGQQTISTQPALTTTASCAMSFPNRKACMRQPRQLNDVSAVHARACPCDGMIWLSLDVPQFSRRGKSFVALLREHEHGPVHAVQKRIPLAKLRPAIDIKKFIVFQSTVSDKTKAAYSDVNPQTGRHHLHHRLTRRTSCLPYRSCMRLVAPWACDLPQTVGPHHLSSPRHLALILRNQWSPTLAVRRS